MGPPVDVPTAQQLQHRPLPRATGFASAERPAASKMEWEGGGGGCRWVCEIRAAGTPCRSEARLHISDSAGGLHTRTVGVCVWGGGVGITPGCVAVCS